jgi:toxin-antitoxin system PIN domain toxin
MHLPDINLWLALTFEAHAHHARAAAWFETLSPRSCAFCRFTQQGFLRLATNPKFLPGEAVSMVEAWNLYDALQRDERVFFAQEPVGLEASWRRHTQKRGQSHRTWSDAYLVAFAESCGLINVSFDKGFRDYAVAKVVILSA